MFIIKHTSWLSSHFSSLKIGVYFRVAFSVSSKSASNSFVIPSNADFCIAITSIVCSIFLWKSNLERLIAGLGNIASIGTERQYLAVYICYKHKSDSLLSYPIEIKSAEKLRSALGRLFNIKFLLLFLPLFFHLCIRPKNNNAKNN